MNGKKTLLVSAILGLSLCMSQAHAVAHSGWTISSSYIWRLMSNSDVSFNSGSPAKIIQLDRNIMHRQAVFKVQRSLTNRYTFKVGCIYQSPTPAIELSVTSLDIAINDLMKGYSFARFMIDKGQEYSLRAEIVPPARLVFSPLTEQQQKKLSDIFLQLSEGGHLKIAVLQGRHRTPRLFNIPLEGFFDISKMVLDDCNKLNSLAQNHRGEVKLLPNYIAVEPADAAPHDFTLKPKVVPTDGLTPLKDPEPVIVPPTPKEEPKADEQSDDELQPPEPTIFTPGGGVSSIGEDGKPITKAPESENLGTAKAMQIGEDGKPISN